MTDEDGAELYRMYLESLPCPTCGAKESDKLAADAELKSLRARIGDVAGMAFVIAEDYCPVGMPTIVSPVDINVARAVSAWLKEGK